MRCIVEKLESLLYTILHWESLILEGGRLQLPKIGGSKNNSGAASPEKRGGSLAVGSYLQRGSAPPPPRGAALRYVGV